MNLVKTEGANISMSIETRGESSTMGLMARMGTTNDGSVFIVTSWMPNVDDIKAINSGRPIMLRVFSPMLEPIVLYTQNEDGEPNI